MNEQPISQVGIDYLDNLAKNVKKAICERGKTVMMSNITEVCLHSCHDKNLKVHYHKMGNECKVTIALNKKEASFSIPSHLVFDLR